MYDCISWPDTFRNYLGLALLDRDLNILKDPIEGDYMDVVIDLNLDIFDANWTPSVLPKNPDKRKLKQWLQDCQLFAASIHSSKKGNQLILMCNEYATPVLLQRRGAPERIAAIDDGTHDRSKIFFRNKYGSGLKLTAIRPPVEVFKGKNMHYFTAGPDKFGPGFLEVWPAGPHEVMPINFYSYPFVNPHFPTKPLESSQPEPAASYKTFDEYRDGDTGDVLKDRDSGSACCVPIQWKDDMHPVIISSARTQDSQGKRKLMLGFSHTKTRR